MTIDHDRASTFGHDRTALARSLLGTIESAIVPLTRSGVARGNKLFGAALVRKDDLSVLLAETNNETENPLWHGEIHLLKRFYESNLAREVKTSELIFLSTHEPCCLCLSAITWCGFDNFFYLFSYEQSRDAFAIPHDIAILNAVFACERYQTDNRFWRANDLMKLGRDDPVCQAAAERLKRLYQGLSETYQARKDKNAIPFA